MTVSVQATHIEKSVYYAGIKDHLVIPPESFEEGMCQRQRLVQVNLSDTPTSVDTLEHFLLILIDGQDEIVKLMASIQKHTRRTFRKPFLHTYGPWNPNRYVALPDLSVEANSRALLILVSMNDDAMGCHRAAPQLH